jgi:hypothetical protein
MLGNFKKEISAEKAKNSRKAAVAKKTQGFSLGILCGPASLRASSFFCLVVALKIFLE